MRLTVARFSSDQVFCGFDRRGSLSLLKEREKKFDSFGGDQRSNDNKNKKTNAGAENEDDENQTGHDLFRPLVVSYIIVKSNYFRLPCQIILIASAVLSLSVCPEAAAQEPLSAFSQGEALFMADKPAEASPFLENAIREDPANVTAYLYLGAAYQQLKRWDQSIDVLKAALPRAGARAALVSYNIANAYFAKGAASFAEQYYTRAIEADGSFASAFLNRANARVKTGALADAVSDYSNYLVLEPASPKRPEIERLVKLIGEEFAAADREKAAAEAAAKAEEERRKKLLDEVAASLQAAAEETKGLSAGSEGVIPYDEDFQIE